MTIKIVEHLCCVHSAAEWRKEKSGEGFDQADSLELDRLLLMILIMNE